MSLSTCDRVSRLKIKYFTGSTRDKNGKVVNHYSNFKVNGAQASQINDVRAKLADEFNNLPARKAKGQLLQSQLNALEEDSKKMEQSLFPEEIKALQESLAEAEKKCKDKDVELKNKKKEISAFEAEKK